ncbi:glutathione S-transferase N-terminal domain-containing protein [Sabulicella glaciei]|uniref:Glutathione S-transferase N-terminal domain-containing protein n=1 Tax=Sabulicella glaciei TaxID=2984948 RepID=A0ABT3P1H6_9PROT|nr:glutathione S-transferase N-terminal domain-containing protein [Roseococcus sp. MDT2-1-1]MCW8087609.1 glutathione S-transferase N-terminal domain-containing protein [Roseococcus sp. MDT2-1-1]
MTNVEANVRGGLRSTTPSAKPSSAKARQLYELCGTDPARVLSPHCWRVRMALAHKGLEFESIPLRLTEPERLAFTDHTRAPVLVDGERVVAGSWDIALYLDEAYPQTPLLFQNAPEAYRAVVSWNDSILQAGLERLIVSDIPHLLDGADRIYFIERHEEKFGQPLHEVTAAREERLPKFRISLEPLRIALESSPFLGGANPDYADYIVFGSFMWARSVSLLRILEAEDRIFAWREEMLNLHGSMARNAPCFSMCRNQSLAGGDNKDGGRRTRSFFQFFRR